MAITYTSGEQVEVYRFSIPATILIPLTAVFLQAWLPLRLHFFSIFDLPLLVTIGFATARRNPLAGLVTGGLIGILQDALTHQPIGLYGISKTVVGFGASSLGIKLDVENAGARFLLTIFFYVVHEVVYFLIARGLIGLHMAWSWPHEILSGLANAVLGVFVFLARPRQAANVVAVRRSNAPFHAEKRMYGSAAATSVEKKFTASLLIHPRRWMVAPSRAIDQHSGES